MRWLKGVVIDRRYGLVQIELETGRKVWTTPTPKLQMCEQVLISWDYTNDEVKHLTTKERLANKETNQDLKELAKSEGFPIPSGEVLEGDVNDLAEPTNDSIVLNKDEESESEERSFPIPLGEDVDCDNVVLLRDDIHIY